MCVYLEEIYDYGSSRVAAIGVAIVFSRNLFNCCSSLTEQLPNIVGTPFVFTIYFIEYLGHSIRTRITL